MAKLNKKAEVFKKRKEKVNRVKEEVNILLRTEEILRSQCEDIDALNKELQEKKGCVGFLETKEKLQNVSSSKASADAINGQTLDQISHVVEEIKRSLKERQSQIRPQIEELRRIRQQFEDLEILYKKKKGHYNNIILSLNTEQSDLDKDVATVKRDMEEDESSYHLLKQMTYIYDCEIKHGFFISRDRRRKSKFHFDQKLAEWGLTGFKTQLKAVASKVEYLPFVKATDLCSDDYLSKEKQLKLQDAQRVILRISENQDKIFHKDQLNSEISKRISGYKDKMTKSINDRRRQLKQLKNEKAILEKNYETHVYQRRWFRDLHKIMECKKKIALEEGAMKKKQVQHQNRQHHEDFMVLDNNSYLPPT